MAEDAIYLYKKYVVDDAEYQINIPNKVTVLFLLLKKYRPSCIPFKSQKSIPRIELLSPHSDLKIYISQSLTIPAKDAEGVRCSR